MEKINKLLEPDNPLGKVFTIAETHSKVPKAYIFMGVCVLLAVYLLFGPGASLLAMLIGFVYPAYRSVFAIESEETEDDTQWLTYWVVYGFFGLAEFFTDIFLSWIPFYYLLKCGFLIWCMAPTPNNGSVIIYKWVTILILYYRINTVCIGISCFPTWASTLVRLIKFWTKERT